MTKKAYEAGIASFKKEMTRSDGPGDTAAAPAMFRYLVEELRSGADALRGLGAPVSVSVTRSTPHSGTVTFMIGHGESATMETHRVDADLMQYHGIWIGHGKNLDRVFRDLGREAATWMKAHPDWRVRLSAEVSDVQSRLLEALHGSRDAGMKAVRDKADPILAGILEELRHTQGNRMEIAHRLRVAAVAVEGGQSDDVPDASTLSSTGPIPRP